MACNFPFHDIFAIKEMHNKSIESRGSLRVKTITAHIKVLEDLNAEIVAEEAKLKEELWSSENTIRGLETQVAEKEEKLAKDEYCINLLESKLADATSKGMVLESRMNFVNLKLDAMKIMVRRAIERAEATKAKA